MQKPLTGVKVLELSVFVAAPSCARLLSDLGAEVIKVERPEGDDWRKVGKSFHADHYTDDFNPVFDIYNSGKRFVSIDLKKPAGMAIFEKLLSEADVFLSNLRPAALKRLGLSYEDLKEKYPRLIYAALLGYGAVGPDADKPAFDGTAFWAKSGFMRDMATVTDDYAPVAAPSAVGDTVSGMFLMGEICAALYRRCQTGKGDRVSATLYHNGIFTMGTMGIVAQEEWGRRLPRTRVQQGLPDGYYRCGDDEWVFFSSSGIPKNVQGFYRILGLSEIFTDPRFDTPEKRKKNIAQMLAEVQSAFLQESAAHWLRLAEEADIPMVRVNHFQDPAQDPQAWENHFVEQVSFPGGQTGVMPTSPLEMDSLGQIRTIPSPCIGYDTRAVLQELGYTREEIDALYEQGVVRTQEG